MEYKPEQPQYKDAAEKTEEKYYSKEAPHKEERKNSLVFDQIFYNIPKGGSISSVPEFHDGVVYFTSLDTHLYAVDADSGKMIWKFKTGAPIISSPVVHNNRIYFGSNDKNFYCLSLDGRLVWKKYLGDIVISYPTAIADRIFIAAGRQFFCLSEKGEEHWRFVTGDGMFNIPTAVNGLVFISSWDKHIYALDMNGKMQWRFAGGGYFTSPIIFSQDKALVTLSMRSWQDMPFAKDPSLYTASSDNNIYSLNTDGTLRWKFTHGSSFSGIINGDGRTIYDGTIAGYLLAIDAATGRQKWSFRTGGSITAGVALAHEKIYLASWDQKLYCISNKGENIWDFLTGGPIAGDPIVVKDRIFFGSADTFFYCLNAKKRTVEWTFQCGFGLPDALQSKLVDVSNTLIEHDKKIIKTWVPETVKNKALQANLSGYMPSDFQFGGEMTYSSNNAYKFDNKYASKRSPYKK
jgi:outer membrane protein assembly factor BamB